MKVVCIDDRVSTGGITKFRVYNVISIEYSMGELYRIVDDNGEYKRYSVEFFNIILD